MKVSGNAGRQEFVIVLTQVYKYMFIAYARDKNWTKVLEAYDRISIAAKLTDSERKDFAKIAELARVELGR